MTTPDRPAGRRTAGLAAGWAAVWLVSGPAAVAQPLPTLTVPPAAPPVLVPVPGGHDTPAKLLGNVKAQPETPKLPATPNADGKPDNGPDAAEKPKDGNGTDEKEKAAEETVDTLRVVPTGVPLNLGECLAIARQNQPTLKAAHHSLEASRLGAASLNSIGRIGERLSPDVPVRRRQAAHGVEVAEAELRKVCDELVYDVTLLYWGYVYAGQQQRTASDVIEQLEVFYKVLEDLLKAGTPGKLNQFTLYTLRDTISEVKMLRLKAVTGQKKALAALREAIGADPSFEFHPKDTELPVMAGAVTKEQVVSCAVSRRPEVSLASAGVQAFWLEVCAQGEVRLRRTVPTLASGSDLHSRQVPMPVRNGEYRPGAIAPEMPTMLVGDRDSRVARATEFALRQDAVLEKTVNLVRLEAENTFIYWETATVKAKETKAKYDNARKMVEQARAAVAAQQEPELVVRGEALAGKAQAEYLEAVFEQVKALATLERVTSGAVRPAFPGR